MTAGAFVLATLFAVASSASAEKLTLNDAQAADLMAGKYYINVHTNANRGGEIRGQVTK